VPCSGVERELSQERVLLSLHITEAILDRRDIVKQRAFDDFMLPVFVACYLLYALIVPQLYSD
jgi:hypothetical protein